MGNESLQNPSFGILEYPFLLTNRVENISQCYIAVNELIILL